MRRFACVWLATFEIDRWRRNRSRIRPSVRAGDRSRAVLPDQPFALVTSGVHGIEIVAANACAIRRGVHRGQALADARAVLPGLITEPHDPARDGMVLDWLALWLGRYGPERNCEGRGGLWVDITGVAHLFGGERALARDCVRSLERAGFRAFVAIADTRAAAWALARYGEMRDGVAIAPPGEMRAALAELPVEGLQLTADAVLLLRRLGLKRIGQLYGLPRAALARRFRDAGHGLVRRRRRMRGLARAMSGVTVRYDGWAEALVMRLDQALGDLSEPAHAIAEPPCYRIAKSYGEPLISHEGIVAALDEAAVRLCRQLDDKGEGARWLRFSVYRADGTVANLEVRTSSPQRLAAHIAALFRERLERIDAGDGIDVVVLEALRVEKYDVEQTTLGDPTHHGAAPELLIDRLTNRLGAGAVYYLAPVASHIPERAQRSLPALADGDDWSGSSGGTTSPQRPAFLLEPAERIEVIAMVPDGPPARFTWRRVARRVHRAQGPERIAPEWWRLIGRAGSAGAGLTLKPEWRIRDYYRIEDEHGAAYWIYRAGLYPSERHTPGAMPAWYMHGLF